MGRWRSNGSILYDHVRDRIGTIDKEEVVSNDLLRQASSAVIDAVTYKSSYSDSILGEYVRKEIEKISKEAAAQAVAELPELKEKLINSARKVVTDILANDDVLNTMVVNAVAKSLAQYRELREDDTESTNE